VSKHVICPDCGGIIGATKVTDEGHPCTCFASDSVLEPSGFSLDDEGASPATAGTGAEKVCITCGKDVRGHRRVKDSRGYQCYACAKAERAQELGDTVRCPACNRRVRETALLDYEGLRICSRCVQERRDVARQTRKRGVVDQRVYQRQEKSQVVWLLIVLLVLLGLGTLGALGLGWF
jgi:DNA-directed RNA polymerase subunit RPC12/RpoP